jgi:hypothetical protein
MCSPPPSISGEFGHNAPTSCADYVERRRTCEDELVAIWPAAMDSMWEERALRACHMFEVEAKESAACLAEVDCNAFARCAATNEQVTISRGNEGCAYAAQWLEAHRPELAPRAAACCENGRPDLVTRCAERPPSDHEACIERLAELTSCRVPSDPARQKYVPLPVEPLPPECAHWGQRAAQCPSEVDKATTPANAPQRTHALTVREMCAHFADRKLGVARCTAADTCQAFADCSIALVHDGWAPPATPETCHALARWVERSAVERGSTTPAFLSACLRSTQVQRKAAACFQSFDPPTCASHLLETFTATDAPGSCDQLKAKARSCQPELASHPVLPPQVPIEQQCESNQERRVAWQRCAAATSCGDFALCVSDLTTDGWTPAR